MGACMGCTPASSARYIYGKSVTAALPTLTMGACVGCTPASIIHKVHSKTYGSVKALQHEISSMLMLYALQVFGSLAALSSAWAPWGI